MSVADFWPGMGTFNLEWSIGTDGAAAYGHVGDTYVLGGHATFHCVLSLGELVLLSGGCLYFV